MRNQLNWSITILVIALVFACQSNQSEPENSNTEEKEAAINAPSIDAQFYCRDLTTSDDMPRAEVSLYLNKARYVIDTIQTCDLFEPADYAKYEIPAEAISACGGWWAGAGDYLYAIVEEDVCIVMQGWQDEQQEDDGFHYERARSFKVIAGR